MKGKILTILLCLCLSSVWADTGSELRRGRTIFSEEDGSPSVPFSELKFPNTSLTDNDDGSGSVSFFVPYTTDLIPFADNIYSIGEATTPLEWKNIYIDGTAYLDTINAGSGGTFVVSSLGNLFTVDAIQITSSGASARFFFIGDDMAGYFARSASENYSQLGWGVGTSEGEVFIQSNSDGTGTTYPIRLYLDATAEYEFSPTQFDAKSNNITTTGTIDGATLNTGQGDYELYKMNQDVDTTASPTFVDLLLSGGDIYPAADSTTAIQINKADGTTNVLNIDTTNGRVGIGDTAPGFALTVNGGMQFTGDLSGAGLSGGYFIRRNADLFIWQGGPEGYFFNRYDNAGTALAIDSAGYVGIGNTDPAYQLDITGYTRIGSGNLVINNANSIECIDGVALPGVIDDGTFDTLLGYQNQAGMKLFDRLASSSSRGALVLLGSFDGAAMAAEDRLGGFLLGGSTGSNSYSFGGGVLAFADAAWSFSNDSPTRLEFLTAPDGSSTRQTRMTIKNSGYVGIGTTGPGYLLEVNGTFQADDYYSGDGSQGITDNTSYWLCTAADCSTSCQVDIKDGLVVGCN